jgi:hypothetical protein
LRRNIGSGAGEVLSFLTVSENSAADKILFDAAMAETQKPPVESTGRLSEMR